MKKELTKEERIKRLEELINKIHQLSLALEVELLILEKEKHSELARYQLAADLVERTQSALESEARWLASGK